MSFSYYNRPSGNTGYRGGGSRNRGSFSSSTSADTVSLPPDRDLMEGLRRQAVQTLSRPQVDTTTGNPVKPENVKYLGSYNWVEESTPTIIVPGSPPEWRERPFPYRVAFDTAVRYVDQNGYRMGKASCLFPLFRAVDVIAEENADTSLDWGSIDIITDRNGLRKLMRWLQYSWEKRTRENAEPPKSGCGINFERESTRPTKGCDRSTGHHRIVQYNMGGLKIIVRCEVDACIPGPASEATTSTTRATASRTTSTHTTSSNLDDLSDMLSGLNVSRGTSTSTTSPTTQSADLTVIHAGIQRPQSSMVELTTRSARYVDQFDWAEQYPQLFLSDVPHLFLAVHERGVFQRIKKHELGTTEFRRVENDTKIQKGFRQLVAVLRTVQSLVKEHGARGRLSLVCRDGRLEVFERTSDQGAVPDSDLERFGV
ncbi:hypothetical protein LXA43DRAFT_1131139 [Ganoderma leucocontextum]|nr:hypothetical protein LXA43DRAFT_1131139 [Ganoderma leucocontextum]